MYYYKIGNLPIQKEEQITGDNLSKYTQITEQEFNQLKTERSNTIQAKARIAELKRNLQNTDYQAIKYAEGELSAEDYASTKAQRQSWRAEINQLESELQL